MGLNPLEKGHIPTQLELQAGRNENKAQSRDTQGWRVGSIPGRIPREGWKDQRALVEGNECQR